ncbi:hypothetical protein ACFOZ7_21755 [Natribaculum luteum]|uniref:Uncharacterized protein n=1 Tax=Natribaculum luteum TaxID=1586232 RepID=A0ABD5P5J8_9EURY|nr:hypothetical protein [Natribaculum luteum]
MSQQRQTPFAATCTACGVDRETASANEIVAFYRRHHRHTGHDVEVTRADVDGDVPDTDDLEMVVAELEAEYEEGVPIGVVAAAMARRGRSVGETLEEIHEVRMTGALYEPRHDHLAAF